jgi:oligopeptidase B
MQKTHQAALSSVVSLTSIDKGPEAKKVRHVTELHGQQISDDYFWMRNRKDPDLIPHLVAENAHHDAYMNDTVQLQKELYAEMRARIKESDETVPAQRGNYFYYTRSEEGRQYVKYCRKLNAPEAKEEVYLDVDKLAEDHMFFEIRSMSVSMDGKYLAYAYDTNGFRQYTLVVKNLQTGEILPDTADRVTSLVWANDDKTLFYTVEDETTKRSNRLLKHRLNQKEHTLVYEENDELFRLGVFKTRCNSMLYVTSRSHTTSETRFINADQPDQSFAVILPREDEIRYTVHEDGLGSFYIVTNDNASNFRLIKAPVDQPAAPNWVEIIPNRENVLLESIDLFKNHLVAFEKEGGLGQVVIHDLHSKEVHRVSFPEPCYTVSSSVNHEFFSQNLRLSYASLVSPNSILNYDMNERQLSVLKTTEIPGYSVNDYHSERIFATASDGTKIPIALVYKKGLIKDSKNPVLLYAYGSYGAGMPTAFSANRLSLLDRGFVFAIAHVRGGNEMGEHWHEQGKMRQKMNTFTDFIACSEHLVEEKYTQASLLTIQGGSAGGLLIGAVVNLRPDLFRASVMEVPFVDVINTMLDENLPLTVGEFVEWGNPKIKEDYEYMRTYSPYENIERKAYPAILVKSALYDSQVMYWEPSKFVARLRELKTDRNPLIFHILLEAGGHTGLSGRFDYLREIAAVQAFLLKQVGRAAC